MNNNSTDAAAPRLRAGWRILIFLIIFWILAATIFLVKPLFGDITKRAFLEDYSIIIVSILAISATIAVSVSRRFLDKKTFVSLGLKFNKRSFNDLLFGFVLSGLMAGVFFGALLAFQLIEFKGTHIENVKNGGQQAFDFVEFMRVLSWGSLLVLLLEHILVGYWEELVFRGYLFQNMRDGMGLKWAVIVSCMVYGLIHAGNPNAGLLSTLIIIIFGYLRIYGYLITDMLWLSIGMHIGWNFFQGPIFGFAASGHSHASLMDTAITSDKNWLTGGKFGPEGSIIIIPIIFLALVAMTRYVKRQGKAAVA